MNNVAQRMFIDLSRDQQILDHAAFVAGLQGEAVEQSAFVKAVHGHLAARNVPLALQLVVDNVPQLLQPKVTDRDLEGQCNLILSVLRSPEIQADLPKYIERFTRTICQAETHTTENPKPFVLMKILTNVYHSIDTNSPVRLIVFKAIVTLAARTHRLATIAPQLRYLDEWNKQWGMTVQQQRQLYMLLHDQFQKGGLYTDAYTCRLKLLATYNTADDTSAEACQHASAAIVEAITAPDLFKFSDLLGLKAVKNVATSSEYQILRALVDGDLAAFEKAHSASKTQLHERGLEYKATKNKMRLATLGALCAKSVGGEIPYADIAKALTCEMNEIEHFIIEAMRYQLVDARMDQLKQVLVVSGATFSSFEPQHWQELSKRLALWQTSVDGVLQVIQNAKLIAQPDQ